MSSSTGPHVICIKLPSFVITGFSESEIIIEMLLDLATTLGGVCGPSFDRDTEANGQSHDRASILNTTNMLDTSVYSWRSSATAPLT